MVARPQDIRTRRGVLSGIVALPLLVGLLSGCAGNADGGQDVLTTFYPLRFLAQRIGGPDVTVGSIVRQGTEPHDYEPSVQDINHIQDARLLVVQGANFETWIVRVRGEAPDSRLVTATAGIDLRENPDSKDELTLPKDPHTWLDPPLYAKMARNVEIGMASAFPEHAAAFHERADLLVADLGTLDAQFRAGLAHCAIPHVITGHAAFGYMAADYGFQQIPVDGMDPDAEPDSATVNHVIDEARRYNITIVFSEELANPAMVQAIAAEIHGENRILSPIEAISEQSIAQGADYFTVQRENLRNLEDAMHCTGAR